RICCPLHHEFNSNANLLYAFYCGVLRQKLPSKSCVISCLLVLFLLSKATRIEGYAWLLDLRAPP
ncbi:unnamed protein product, partial [Prunus brigantina]